MAGARTPQDDRSRGPVHRLSPIVSRSTLYSAWKRVWENGGCRGSDGVTVGTFRDRLEWELDSIEDGLIRHSYHPLPLLRFAVPKPGGNGIRHLSVPTIRDRVVQSAIYLETSEVFEAELEDSSYAYRKGRSVRDAVRKIRTLRDEGYRWVVDADIAGFFDRIPHGPLLDRVHGLGLDPYTKWLFRLWTEAEIYDGESLWALQEGIPQGSVVSPMLANLFLDALDEDLAAAGLVAVRYADDLVILCKSSEEAAAALELTDDLLEAMELDLSRDKTEIRSFEQGFKFLGALFVGDSVYLPFDRKKPDRADLKLPPPLDLVRYIELAAHSNQPSPCPPSTSPNSTPS